MVTVYLALLEHQVVLELVVADLMKDLQTEKLVVLVQQDKVMLVVVVVVQRPLQTEPVAVVVASEGLPVTFSVLRSVEPLTVRAVLLTLARVEVPVTERAPPTERFPVVLRVATWRFPVPVALVKVRPWRAERPEAVMVFK